ncbi:MAG: glycosyltransferase family 2 protein [Alphaproteobacteria bacterium]|jgi:glycosyltransferase involved in cell wall biosynthesis|nr:glycosyltransferase family 2 protein [Alphaproteobacteria bacterium]HJP21945.1 glycosyltransferase family 2 protein [Alphaproteobacteria bacterium]
MTAPRLSALVVAHNEERQLAACLERLAFADEIVVVLDRCDDASATIAGQFTERLIEGAWPLEGDRRNAGIEACAGDWIIEVDADERLPEALAVEIRETIVSATPGHFLVPFDNYIGSRLVRHGWGASWGVSAAPRLFSRGAKRWGRQRIHPSLELQGGKRFLKNRMDHYVDRDLSDMLARLDRYTTARAKDLRDQGDIGSFAGNLRRLISRFLKCYLVRRGYREGAWGFVIALMAGLYPLLSYLKARLAEAED